MVGYGARKTIREYFNLSPEQIRQNAKDSEISIDEYYANLQVIMRAEKAEKTKKRRDERNRLRRNMRAFLDGEIESFTINLDNLEGAELETLFNELDLDGGQFLIETLDGDKTYQIYTYNDRMKGVWAQIIQGSQFQEITEGTGSDAKVVDVIKNYNKVRITKPKKPLGEGLHPTLHQGAFFKYYLHPDFVGIDLSKFGIFSSEEHAKACGNYKDNCLLEALRAGDASEETLQIVRSKMMNRHIKHSDIKFICEEANIYIRLKIRYTPPTPEGEPVVFSKGKLKITPHGDPALVGIHGKHFEIGLIDEHYFLIDDLSDLEYPISTYCLKNWEKMKDNLPFNYGRREANKKARAKECFSCSFKLVEKLLDGRDKFLVKIPRTNLLKTQYYDQNKELSTLTVGDENFEPMEKKLERVIKRYRISQEETTVNIFLDFETNTRARQAKHTIDVDGNISTINQVNRNKKVALRHKAYLGCCKAVWWKAGRKWEGTTMTFYDNGVRTFRRGDETFIYEDTPGRQMVKYIANTYYHFNNVNLIAHNAGYDLRVGLFPYLYQYEGIENGTALILGSANIYPTTPNAKKFLKDKKRPLHIPVKIKCSYRMMDIKLAKFGETFDLSQKKEYMPYDLYTTENLKARYVDFEVCINVVLKDGEKKKKVFLENVNAWRLYDSKTNKIDIIGYSREYCKLDCEVLADGYEKFRGQIKEISQKVIHPDIKKLEPDLFVDIYNQYTISSVANELLLIGGCYNNTYQFAGVVREFIQKCVVGGRVMPCENKKVKIVGGVSKNKHTGTIEYIQDFDGVSLYPSALCRIPGFIKGLPKILPDMSGYTTREDIMNILNTMTTDNESGSVSHYFIEININRVGIRRQFPLMSYTDGLTRKWTNDVIGSDDYPIPMYCDRTMLEDWIKFHDIDFVVVRGYYFNRGYNPQINMTMRLLFDKRLEEKSKGNPIQNTYKLCMNSGYGKTLEKAHEDTILYKTEKEYDAYVARKYNFIKQITPTIDGRYKCKEWATIDKHYNQVHQGVSVLSMSKRIMGEVMCLAEDKGYGMFYTDTDSIHMYSECVNLLAKDWKKMYGGRGKRPYELIGKSLGQFHNDFDLVDSNWDEDLHHKNLKKAKNVYSIGFIGLGKKCYIDLLVGTSQITKKDCYGAHIRMKGVSEDAVLYSSYLKNKEDRRDGGWKLYENLLKGNEETFDLCRDKNGNEKLCFKFFNDFSIGNMNDEETAKGTVGFSRTVKFLAEDILENNDFKNIE